jgi:hypothetical protein
MVQVGHRLGFALEAFHELFVGRHAEPQDLQRDFPL